MLRLEQLELALDEVDKAPSHAPRHRRVAPPRPSLEPLPREDAPERPRSTSSRWCRLVTADAPDVVALQERPLWAVKRLDDWSGMEHVVGDDHARPPGAARAARRPRGPVRFRSSLTGQANALLVESPLRGRRAPPRRPQPGALTRDRLLRGGQRPSAIRSSRRAGRARHAGQPARVEQPTSNWSRRRSGGRRAFVAKRGAASSAATSTSTPSQWPASTPIDGIDQISSAASSSSAARSLAGGRRRLGEAVLSDHAPGRGGDRIDLVACPPACPCWSATRT